MLMHCGPYTAVSVANLLSSLARLRKILLQGQATCAQGAYLKAIVRVVHEPNMNMV